MSGRWPRAGAPRRRATAATTYPVRSRRVTSASAHTIAAPVSVGPPFDPRHVADALCGRRTSRPFPGHRHPLTEVDAHPAQDRDGRRHLLLGDDHHRAPRLLDLQLGLRAAVPCRPPRSPPARGPPRARSRAACRAASPRDITVAPSEMAQASNADGQQQGNGERRLQEHHPLVATTPRVGAATR